MAWYFYTGSVVRPIPVKPGLSKSVRPQSKVEILEVTAESQALIRKGQLRLTGRPKGAGSVADAPVPEKKIADMVPKSPMAMAVAEKGVTLSASIPPKALGGAEMTEGEISGRVVEKEAPKVEVEVEVEVSDPVGADDDGAENAAEEIDQAGALNDDTKKAWRKKRR